MSLPIAKISKLIPRLGSTFDNEVVATARAIERTLKADGSDWHAFARAFDLVEAQPPKPARPDAYHRRSAAMPPPPWCLMAAAERRAWLEILIRAGSLSDWEYEFVVSMTSRLLGRTSEKQEIILNRLIGRAFSMGEKP